MAGTGPTGFAPTISIVVAGLGLFLLSALWHELGHAAAVARSGYPPGGIGAGLLFVIPVLYADVSAVGVLPRRERVRVDLAGIIFQLGAGGGMAAAGRVAGIPQLSAGALTLAGFSALAAVLWSLIPFVRSDGYWLLCDLLDLETLEKPAPAPHSLFLRIFLVVYQLANVAFLLTVAFYFPWRVIGSVLTLAEGTGLTIGPVAANRLAWGAFLTFLALTGGGLTCRIRGLVGAALQGCKSMLGH
jgi:hypothetical protein